MGPLLATNITDAGARPVLKESETSGLVGGRGRPHPLSLPAVSVGQSSSTPASVDRTPTAKHAGRSASLGAFWRTPLRVIRVDRPKSLWHKYPGRDSNPHGITPKGF